MFPPAPVRLSGGERADFLSEFTQAVGGDVTLNRKYHTAGAHLFAGSKALRTQACQALLGTGRPAFFIREKVWLRMLACGGASEDELKYLGQKTWGVFHGTPVSTPSQVRLNVQLGNVGTLGRSSTVCLVAHAHILPDSAMSTAALFGRDSWSRFPVRKHRDVNETKQQLLFRQTRLRQRMINVLTGG